MGNTYAPQEGKATPAGDTVSAPEEPAGISPASQPPLSVRSGANQPANYQPAYATTVLKTFMPPH